MDGSLHKPKLSCKISFEQVEEREREREGVIVENGFGLMLIIEVVWRLLCSVDSDRKGKSEYVLVFLTFSLNLNSETNQTLKEVFHAGRL